MEKESMVIPNYQLIGSQATKQNIFSFESSIEGQLNLMPKNNQNMFNRSWDTGS